jgi:DNA-binding SARP family transcriptional activator/tetratricopeptide (TPR) repeat protein
LTIDGYGRCVLRVQLLGEFAVSRDQVPVPLPSGLARLTAFLALRPAPQNRDLLAGRFWPDSSADAARSSLRTAVWELRRALGPQTVVASRSEVGLAPGAVSVDVQDVEVLARRGDLAAAAALCRGELLPDLSEDWADQARAAHHRRHSDLLDRLAAAAEDGRDPATAARWSRLRCDLDPLDEAAHARLLQRLAAAGDRSGGLLAGREFARRLRAELGLDPGPAVRAAFAELRGPGSSGSPGAGGRNRLQPMFGRSEELATVMAAWGHARAGSGRIIVVTGEGGVGKTRLISEVARRVVGAGARAAVGAGVDVGGEAPLAIWHELARELVAVVPTPPPSAAWPAELGRLAPDLAAALGHPAVPPPVASPELERLRIFDAVLRLVEWAAAQRPLLLVAEDLHRADRASIALCTHIGRRLAGLPVLFLLTRRARPERADADALLADVAGRGTDVGEIELGPLAERDLAAVIRSVSTLSDDQVLEVVANADGNPLLAVERARALAAGRTEPPSTLRAAVRATVGALPRPSRDLVEVLAVAGRALSPGEVAALGLPDAAGAEAAALNTDLVRRDRTGLRFRHALLAEAARADLQDRAHRHKQVAIAVEAAADRATEAGQVASEVARHLQLAGRDDLAGERWRAAARHARSLGALPEAAEFWGEAARCAPDDAEPRLELAEVHAWLGRRDAFDTEWQAVLALVPGADLAMAWYRRGNVMRAVLCHPSEGLAAYRRALELLPPGVPGPLRAAVLAGLAQVEAVGGEPERTAALLAEAEDLGREPGPTSSSTWPRLGWPCSSGAAASTSSRGPPSTARRRWPVRSGRIRPSPAW